MSLQENYEEVEAIDSSDDIDESVDEQTPEREDPEVEDKAFKIGWKPRDQYRGDPDKWVPASVYLERGENYIPILRKQVTSLEAKNQAIENHMRLLQERLHKEKKEELKKRQLRAVEIGDKEEYVAVDKEMEELDNDLAKQGPKTPDQDPTWLQWVQNNSWYTEDFDKARLANDYGAWLRTSKPHLKGVDFLDEVSRYVFEKSQNPRRKNSSVDGGRYVGMKPKKSGPSIDDVPKEDLKYMKEYVAAGLGTEDQWLADYFAN